MLVLETLSGTIDSRPINSKMASIVDFLIVIIQVLLSFCIKLFLYKIKLYTINEMKSISLIKELKELAGYFLNIICIIYWTRFLDFNEIN
jgi:hypothetical protein